MQMYYKKQTFKKQPGIGLCVTKVKNQAASLPLQILVILTLYCTPLVNICNCFVGNL